MNSPASELGTRTTSRVRDVLSWRLGRPFLVAVASAAFMTLWAFSVPGGPDMGVFVFLMLGWMAIGALWLLRLLAALIAGGFGRVSGVWQWWVTPVVIVLATAGLLVTSAPLLVRFELSQGAMEELAREATANGALPRPDRVGLFPVERVTRFQGGMRFLVKGAGFLDPGGFAFSPDGRPPNLGGEDHYFHLEGPWYVWQESW